MKEKTLKKGLQLLIGIFGAYLIIHFASWQVLIGVILIIWANNFDYKREE